MLKTALAAIAVIGTLAGTAAPAAAQSAWGVRIGIGPAGPGYYGGYGYNGGYGGYGYNRGPRSGERLRDYVCSGARAHQLEDRLRHEVREGDIDDYHAQRIHSVIDATERDQRYACSGQGDWDDVQSIVTRYDRIEGWISNAEQRGNGYYGRGW